MSHVRARSVRHQHSLRDRAILSAGAEARPGREELDSAAESHAHGHGQGSTSNLDKFSYDEISSILSREDALFAHAPDSWQELVLESPDSQEVQHAEKTRKSCLVRSEAGSSAYGWAGKYTSWLKVGKLVVNGNEHALERTHQLYSYSDLSNPGVVAGPGIGRYQLVRDVILTAKGLYIVEAHTDVRSKGRGVIDVVPLSEIVLPLRVDGDHKTTGLADAWQGFRQWCIRCTCCAQASGPRHNKVSFSFIKLPLPKSSFVAGALPGSKRAALISAISSAMEVDTAAVEILTVTNVHPGESGGNGGAESKERKHSPVRVPAGQGQLRAAHACVVDFSVKIDGRNETSLGRLQDPMRARFEVTPLYNAPMRAHTHTHKHTRTRTHRTSR